MRPKTRFRRILLVLAMLLPVSTVWAEREEELAGETAPKPVSEGPKAHEPEQSGPAARDRERPSLKLPEIVVKGEKEYRLSAERRDVLTIDPMSETRETPADLSQVAVPGLSPDKDSPSVVTAAAKTILFTAEAGAGSDEQLFGKLMAGQEIGTFNYLLRAEYGAGTWPRAFGFRPYLQGLQAGLDLRTSAVPGADLALGLAGQSETARQPRTTPGGWGDWLTRGQAGVNAQANLDLSSSSSLKVQTGLTRVVVQGEADQPVAGDFAGYEARLKADWDLDLVLDGLPNLALIVRGEGWLQQGAAQRTGLPGDYFEACKMLLVSTRVSPDANLRLELGVRLDDFQGEQGRSLAAINGQASWLAPFGAAFYAELTPGLEARPLSAWFFEHPHPQADGLPAPEAVVERVRAGWKQRWLPSVLTEVSWSWRKAHQTRVWADADLDGLFSYAAVARTQSATLQAEANIQYAPQFKQRLVYYHRQAETGSGDPWPYLPQYEALMELKWTASDWEGVLGYRWLGARATLASSSAPVLADAHLLSAQIDVFLGRGWTVFTRMDNLLGVAWEPWAGYAQRGVNGWMGLRYVW